MKGSPFTVNLLGAGGRKARARQSVAVRHGAGNLRALRELTEARDACDADEARIASAPATGYSQAAECESDNGTFC